MSDEKATVNPWTVVYFVIAAGLVGLLIMFSKESSGSGFRTAFAFITIAVAGVVVAMRFDTLLTMEFHEKTWGSLMLLPVDPCEILGFKLQAALWEQRFLVMPIAVVMLGQLIYEAENFPGGVMAILIVIPACLLLCQLTALTQLLGKAWWLGPCQIIGFVAVTAGVIAIWIECGLWLGFVLAELFLIAVVSILHKTAIQPTARQWIETE